MSAGRARGRVICGLHCAPGTTSRNTADGEGAGFRLGEYEIQPDLVGRAEALMAQTRRFNTCLSAPGRDELVERKAL